MSGVRFFAAVLAVSHFASLAAAQDEKAAAPAVANVNLVPLDAPVVISLRPGVLLKNPQIKTVYDNFISQDEVKKVVDIAEPDSVEEITLVLLERDINREGDPREAIAKAGAIIVRTNKPREWKALAAAAQVPVVKATHAGVDYFRLSGDAPVAFGFYQPSETTVILASDTNLQKMIEGVKAGGEAKPPKIAGSSSKTTAATAVDMSWVRELVNPQIKAMPGASVGMSVIGPIWEKTTYATARIDIDDAQKISVVAENLCADEGAAKDVEKTVEALLTLGRNVSPELFKTMRVEFQEQPIALELADLGEQAIRSATLTREGTRVRLQISVKVDIAKLSELMLGK